MIEESQYIYYFSFGVAFVCVAVLYLKIKSTESIVITTKEFKNFQSNFLIGYVLIMLGELVAIGSFYHTMVLINLSLDKITKLYVITLISSTSFGILLDIVDIGSKRNKCIACAFLYTISMTTVYFGAHFELLLLGRVVYGAASSLLHTTFDTYLINEHSSLGFPDDWLNQTFSMLTHSMALVSALSGVIGQTTARFSALGPIFVCVALFLFVTIFIVLSWGKDLSGSRFMISGFVLSMKKLYNASLSNKLVGNIVMLSACCEASITIFTFYWAPWLTSVNIDKYPISSFPYELIFSTYLAGSMVGAYFYQIVQASVGQDNLFQITLVGLSASYFLGAVFHTPLMVFGVSLVIHFFHGMYWPSVGHCRGTVILPEMRSSSLCMSK